MLPGVNCGSCGFADAKNGRGAFENAVPKQCKPLRQEKVVALQAYLDEYFKNKQ